jgi:hypothetical protein
LKVLREERVVPLDPVELADAAKVAVKVVAKDAVKDVVKGEGEALVAVVVPVAVALKVVVVVGQLVPALVTKISVETVLVVADLLVPDRISLGKGVLDPDLVPVLAAVCR